MDLVIKNLIEKEKERQQYHLEMIASENFASEDVMNAQGSISVSYTHLRAHET